jgi:hypothetical protein
VRTNISFQTTINYEKRKRKRIVLVVVVVVVAVGKKKEERKAFGATLFPRHATN